jgi:hypothetical protein
MRWGMARTAALLGRGQPGERPTSLFKLPLRSVLSQRRPSSASQPARPELSLQVCQTAHQIHAPIPVANAGGARIEGMRMTEQQQERLAQERKEIRARVAKFKATQEKFQREREEYYATKMRTARATKWNKFAGGELNS